MGVHVILDWAGYEAEDRPNLASVKTGKMERLLPPGYLEQTGNKVIIPTIRRVNGDLWSKNYVFKVAEDQTEQPLIAKFVGVE